MPTQRLPLKQDRWGCLLCQVQACGHRVVHGKDIPRALLVSAEVERQIEDAASLAPLHNPPNLEGIRAAARIFVGTPQVQLDMYCKASSAQTGGEAWTPQASIDEHSHISALPCSDESAPHPAWFAQGTDWACGQGGSQRLQYPTINPTQCHIVIDHSRCSCCS